MTDQGQTSSHDLEQIEKLKKAYSSMKEEVRKVIVGQDEVVDELFMALFCKGHCLLMGVPGLAKTLMISTLSKVLNLSFNRIQFTPDLMPSDITGTEVIQEDKASGQREFKFIKGPIFANVVLADEINRTPPKTQAALLESMVERQVSAGGNRHELPDPFFVLATQNPIEQEGTYPLPEAQLDRFMFNVKVEYPSSDEELDIMKLTTSTSTPKLDKVLDSKAIIELQETVRRVPVADSVLKYAVRLVRATRIDTEDAPSFMKESLAWGAGPRATQNLILGGKARALLQGRFYVSSEDIRSVAHPVLRHRLITNYTAEAEGLTSDALIDRLLETILPAEDDGGKLPEVFGS